MTSAFSKSSGFTVQTITTKQRFQISSLSRAFSNLSVFSGRKRRIRVDETRIRRDIFAFSNLSGYVSTRPQKLRRNNIERNSRLSYIQYVCANVTCALKIPNKSRRKAGLTRFIFTSLETSMHSCIFTKLTNSLLLFKNHISGVT